MARTLGPGTASLQVHTFREGMASKAGHDLILDVTAWEATVDEGAGTVELTADPRSLHVREGHRGVKPLSDRDRAEIRRNIDGKVLRGRPVRFRSTSVEATDGGSRLAVSGELELNDRSRHVAFTLDRAPDGRVSGTVAVVQSQWGIKPYTAFMGALKVRDAVDVVIDAPA